MNKYLPQTYKVDLISLDSITLLEARKKVNDDLSKYNGAPVLIKMPDDYQSRYKIYKAILSHLFTLTNPQRRLVTDEASFNLCKLYSNGMLEGDSKSGYYFSSKCD